MTNVGSNTRIDEIADGVYRINTPVTTAPGGFSFNQYLVADVRPLLFHTGPRSILPSVAEAIETILPVKKLAYIGFSHFESDECGALNHLLGMAPDALPLCGQVNAMINADAFDRPPFALDDGQLVSLGTRRVRWFDTPHLPHGWECGYLMEEYSRTLLCGDLFTQGGSDHPPLTTREILGPSEAFRARLDYFSHTKNAGMMLKRLASARPATLACMHGSAWQGDGAGLLLALSDVLDR